MENAMLARIAAAATLCATLAVPAGAQQPGPQDMQRGRDFLQKSMAMMKPELAEKAKALPPEIQRFLLKIAIKHDRHSDSLTLVQVMHEILADHQAVGAAIAADNGALAAEAARRIAGHRLPRGGLLPYLPLDKVNARDLGVLPAMEEAVEGGALRLAAAAEQGDMVAAARHYGDVTAGCVACHAHFRGRPGASARLK